MKRYRWIWALLGLGIVVVFGPMLLRPLPLFRVRQIEFVGMRILTPEQLISGMRLPEDYSVFASHKAVRERLVASGLVSAARIRRRLPGTIRVEIVERTPVAFVATGDGLRPVDRFGAVLPYDPQGSELDLPILERPDSLAAGVLYTVLAVDPGLFQEVQSMRRRGDSALVIQTPLGNLVLPGRPTMETVEAIGAVRRHLETQGELFDEIDARFGGWVVVRPRRS